MRHFEKKTMKNHGHCIHRRYTERHCNVLNKDKTHVIEPLMFYDHRRNVLFKALSYVIYCIIDRYVCLYYLFINKEI